MRSAQFSAGLILLLAAAKTPRSPFWSWNRPLLESYVVTVGLATGGGISDGAPTGADEGVSAGTGFCP